MLSRSARNDAGEPVRLVPMSVLARLLWKDRHGPGLERIRGRTEFPGSLSSWFYKSSALKIACSAGTTRRFISPVSSVRITRDAANDRQPGGSFMQGLQTRGSVVSTMVETDARECHKLDQPSLWSRATEWYWRDASSVALFSSISLIDRARVIGPEPAKHQGTGFSTGGSELFPMNHCSLILPGTYGGICVIEGSLGSAWDATVRKTE